MQIKYAYPFYYGKLRLGVNHGPGRGIPVVGTRAWRSKLRHLGCRQSLSKTCSKLNQVTFCTSTFLFYTGYFTCLATVLSCLPTISHWLPNRDRIPRLASRQSRLNCQPALSISRQRTCITMVCTCAPYVLRRVGLEPSLLLLWASLLVCHFLALADLPDVDHPTGPGLWTRWYGMNEEDCLLSVWCASGYCTP